MTSRTLVLMRHAKAEVSAPTDFERRLTDRGHADADDVGAWLASQGVEPDYALVSAAARTVETWEDLSAAAGWDVALAEYVGALYDAGTDTALDIIRETDEGVTALVVVGHNPTIAYLAQLLDDGDGDEEGGNAMAAGFPTAAVAVFAFSGEWSELDEASATLNGFYVGRG